MHALSPLALAALIVATAPAFADEAKKPGTVFKDCKDCPEMVVLPAGSFTMGTLTTRSAASPTRARCTT